jgi:(2Fe-2S) ferredoxin
MEALLHRLSARLRSALARTALARTALARTALARQASARPAPAADTPGCLVTVCRGCCCGTPGKHPGVDHSAHLARLRTAVADGGRLRQSGCLDLCELSNVVVVGPSAAGRRKGGRTLWFVEILDDRLVSDITDWIGAGGPGVLAPPARLAEHLYAPSRRGRQAIRG